MSNLTSIFESANKRPAANDSSTIEKEKKNPAKDFIARNKEETKQYLERQDKNLETKLLIKKIADNTDTIIDILRDGVNKKDNKGSLADLLKLLALGLPALLAAANPEAAKPIVSAIKAATVAADAAKAAIKALDAAATSKNAVKAGQAAADAADGSKIVKAVDEGSSLAKLSKFAGDKLNGVTRVASAGMIAGRWIEGDLAGMTAEATSLALHEASRHIPNAKLKLAATVGSFLIDAGLMIRDYFKGAAEKAKGELAKKEGFVAPEKASFVTNVANKFGYETEQAKRIKQQEAALTPEQKEKLNSIDDQYSLSNKSGEFVKENAGGIAGVAAGAATGALVSKGLNLYSNVPNVSPGKGGMLQKALDLASKNKKTKFIAAGLTGLAASTGVESLFSNKEEKPIGPITKERADELLSTPEAKEAIANPTVNAGSAMAIGGVAGLGVAKLAQSASSKIGSLMPTKAVAKPAAQGATKIVAQGAAKTAGKLVPGVGLALGGYFAYERAKQGDILGAIGEAASGIASTVPGLGTAAAVAIQGGLIARDIASNTEKSTTKNIQDNAAASKILADTSKKNADQTAAGTKFAIDSQKSVDNSVIKANTGFTGFIKNTGTSIVSWLGNIKDAFAGAISTLASIGTSIWNKIKSFSFSNMFGGSDTAAPTDSKSQLDTSSGEYGLGKNGGNLVGLLDKGESGGSYGVYNYIQGGKVKTGKTDNNNMTVGQLKGLQSSKKINAFGRYQMIGGTFKEGVAALGIKDNEKVTAKMQDRIFRDHLFAKKRPDLKNYVIGKNNDLNAAVLAGAQEWASVGVPYDMKGNSRQVKKGQSYYAGDGLNKAHVTPEEFGAGLKVMRNRYNELIKEGKTPEQAYQLSFEAKDSSAKGFAGKVADGAQKLFGSPEKIAKDGKGSPTAKATSAPNYLLKDGGASKIDKNPLKGNLTGSGVQASGQKALGKKDDSKSSGSSSSASSAKSDTSSKAEKQSAKSASFNLDTIVDYALKNAKFKSRAARAADKKTPYWCARYVRKAIQAGDNTKKVKEMGDAKEWGKKLPQIGWVAVSGAPKKGDIAWFPKTNSEFGHVCLYTGNVWVSDWIQGNNPQPNTKNNFSYTLFRAKSGFTNGAAVGAESAGEIAPAGETDGKVGGGSETGDTTAGESSSFNFSDSLSSMVKTGLNALSEVLNSDTARSALKFVTDSKIDGPAKDKKDALNNKGFVFDKHDQTSTLGYKHHGNGTQVDLYKNEFNPNLIRQEGDTKGTYRKMNSIADEIIRQRGDVNDTYGQMNTISKKAIRQGDKDYNQDGSETLVPGQTKKKKWYDKMFNFFGTSTDDIKDTLKDDSGRIFKYTMKNHLEGMVGDATGQDVKGLFGADIKDVLYKPTQEKLDALGYEEGTKLTKDEQKNMLFKSIADSVISTSEASKANPKASKTGWGGFVNKSLYKIGDSLKESDGNLKLFTAQSGLKAATYLDDKVQKFIGKPAQTDTGLIPGVTSGQSLAPNIADRNKVDGHISELNKKYQDKVLNKNQPAAQIQVQDQGSSSQSLPKTRSNPGLDAPMVTRNPDSIYREISIGMMFKSVGN